jgi:hypothetical protein
VGGRDDLTPAVVAARDDSGDRSDAGHQQCEQDRQQDRQGDSPENHDDQ